MSAAKPMPTIKPCPFCGSEIHAEDDLTYRGFLCSCGAEMRVHPPVFATVKGVWRATDAGRRRAITAWNKRAKA